MKNKINSVLNFSIIALFFTNLWLIVYNGLLTFVNFTLPPVVSSGLLREIAFPNPGKTLIYLVLTFIFLFIFWLIWGRYKARDKQISISYPVLLLKAFLLLLLLTLFANKLGDYPLAFQSSLYNFSLPASLYFFIFLIAIAAVAFFIFQAALLQKFLTRNGIYFKILLGVIFFLVAVLTFEPRFPLSGHDYAFILGPVQEILNHKTIYTDIPSQHGLLPILIFTLLHKFTLIKFALFPAVIWLLYSLQYFLSFYLILQISRSLPFSFLAMFSILIVNYFSLYHLPATLPQTGPLRWLPSLIVLLIFLKARKIGSTLLITAVSLSLFWILDSGMALLLAYFATLGVFYLKKLTSLKKVFFSCLFFLLSALLIFILINLAQLTLGYKWIDAGNIFSAINQYAVLGVAQEPIPQKTFFWVFVLIYLSSLLYFFQSKKNDLAIQLLVFCANISLFSSIYYVSRSNPHNLFHIGYFVILTVFILLANIFVLLNSIRMKIGIVILAFVFFIFYPAYMRHTSLVQLLIVKYQGLRQGKMFEPEFEKKIRQYYSSEINLINKHLTKNKVLILHTDDTYLLYLANKSSFLLENPQVGILTYDRLKRALSETVKVCPKEIAVDCSGIGKCPAYKFFGEPSFTVPIMLAELEKQCKIEYKPIVCSNKLCIEGYE